MFGDQKVAPGKATIGTVHDYLAMKLDFTLPEKLKVEMVDYFDNMVKYFTEEFIKSIHPWNDNLFKVDTKDTNLPKENRNYSHICCKRTNFMQTCKARHTTS
jgi:hypothetical protein